MTKRLGIAEALREAIAEEMERDERVFCIGEDIAVPGGWGGAFTVTLGLEKKFPDRMIDTPIAELGFFGVACGAAMMGMRPIADVQYGDFLLLASDQIINNIAKMRYMSGGQIKMPLVMRAPLGATGRGSQHAQSLERYFTGVPGLRVEAVSNAYDAKGILKSAVRDDNPVMIFEHKLLYGSKGARAESGAVDATSDIPDEEYTTPLGKAAVCRDGAERHHTRLAPDAALLAPGRPTISQRGHQRRGDRRAKPFPLGLGDDRRVGPENGPCGCRRGGAEDRIGQCGDCRQHHGKLRRKPALSDPSGGLGQRPCAVHAGAGERLPPRRAADRPGGARGHAILNQEVAPWKRMHRFVPAAALSSARPWSPHWVDCSSGLTRRSPVPTSLSTPGVSCLRDGHVQSAHWHQCDAVLCTNIHAPRPVGFLALIKPPFHGGVRA